MLVLTPHPELRVAYLAISVLVHCPYHLLYFSFTQFNLSNKILEHKSDLCGGHASVIVLTEHTECLFVATLFVYILQGDFLKILFFLAKINLISLMHDRTKLLI